ncbi:5-(carboxyamino)imidazole ribonucleotide synthase [Alkalihalobacillus sp. 1P02AB]|uniref:5-(carboxyamino)imidazole ribonucleotide synthase n=1 Tax=Alkalihalobacillus sp. 1P02AB TaxID=3132260 RepID=UPI0039A6B32B
MSQPLTPGATIGIIGGGQLGRMMAMAARQMGYRIAVLEPTADSPCGQIADVQIEKGYDDLDGAKLLADVSDLITYEFENIDQKTAGWMAEQCFFPQGDKLLKITQHRLKEKQAIEALGVKVAPHRAILAEEMITQAGEDIGFPAVLKTCRGGYDGKGQAVVNNHEELNEAARRLLKHGELVLEAWIPFQCEVSVIVTRSTTGEVKTFPVAENIHRNNILYRSIVPARVSQDIQDVAKRMALTIAEGLGLVGTLAVEFFVGSDGTLFVNELAPRPHNSGHYTIEACETSQFEQHIRAVSGWPLGETTLHNPVVMENILGEDLPQVLANIEQFNDIKLHLYGKAEAKEKRKMGHLTVMAKTVEEALQKLDERS